MTDVVTCRFMEYEYYDVQHDRIAMRLEAITNNGTWYTDIEAGKNVRKQRSDFQEAAITYIQNGLEPGYIDLNTSKEIH